jgi:(p)ppGpp synthase/HD superfamily hydrolase
MTDSAHGVLLVARAFDFAARRHVAQRRKGEAAEPYVNHLAEVAALLAEATDGKDAALVAAGLLHDTIEDQGVTQAELEDAFGATVAKLVAEVTDDKELDWEERKRLQVALAPTKSKRARLIKLADKTSNLRSIARDAPETWSTKRQHDYVEWATKVIAGCRGSNPRLETAFDVARTAALAKIARRR